MLPKTVICDTDIGRFLLFRSRETISNALLTQGDFEPLGRQILAGLFPGRDAVVVDAGTNVGTFTIPVATANPHGRIHAFEAQRVVYYQLCANIILNSLDNVRATLAAVGNPAGSGATIEVPVVNYGSANNLGAVSLVPEVRQQMLQKNKYVVEGMERVSLLSLDAAVLPLEARVDFLKVDVEGMELQVLEGASQLIARDKPVVFFESWSSAQDERRKLADFFTARGYSTHFLGEDALAMPPGPLRSGRRIQLEGDSLRII